MEEIKKIKLNDGYEIPQLGFGTWLLEGNTCYEAVLNALKIGYRHIDTAEAYLNLKEIGQAIKDSGIPREEIFITTKIWITDFKKENVYKSINFQLKQLGLEYLDLVLLHRSYYNYIEAWEALVELKKEGKIHSLGLSNFNIKKINKIISLNSVIPAVNQVECHIEHQRNKLRKYLDENGIKMEAYFPLGHGKNKIINNPAITEIAKKHKKSNTQIVLRWHIQKNNIIFPKSANPEHIKNNYNIFDFNLDDEDMNIIKSLNKDRTIDRVPILLQYPVYYLFGLKIRLKRKK